MDDPTARCHLIDRLELAIMRGESLHLKNDAGDPRRVRPVDLITRDGEDFLITDRGEALPLSHLRLAVEEKR